MDNWTNDSEFLETFRAEAEERLRNLSEGLMALEESPGDEELIKRLFREAHTLKGSAGMMGLTAIKELAHKAEDILSSVQKGQLKLDQGVTDLLLESLDRIEELLPSGECKELAAEDVTDLLDRLDHIDGNKENRPVEKPDRRKEPPVPDRERVASINDASVAAGERRGASECDSGQDAAAGFSRSDQKAAAPEVKSDPTIRINIERLDKLLNLMGEVIVNQIDNETQVRELSSIQSRTREIKSIYGSLVEQVDQLKEGASPEDIAAFSQSLNLALDEASDMSDRLESATAHLKENSATRRLALDELQDRTLHVRMLPLSTIFGMYPRVVRDCSRASGKNVRLVIEGEGTELDKRILEQISDPLMHIIRNCVDHGIENPEQRVENGKPEQGTIRLKAFQRGDRVEIEIEDDGAGINPAKVKKAARDKGIVATGEELSDDDAMELIFRPGFSTAEKVTEISGRGVGLDVVKNNIEKLEGTVSLESIPGNGSKFTVSLPVTLAVISGLLVKSNGSRFIIPLGSVKEMVALDPSEIQTIGNHKGFLIRENAIPVLDLLDYLGGGETPQEKDKVQVVIVQTDKYLLGLNVGSLVGEQEVVIKPLAGFLSDRMSVAGVTVLGSGEVVVVLNINEIVRMVRKGAHSVSAASAAAAESERLDKKSIMVVEDSLVVRELQRNILEAAGYDVHTAVDGQDAIGKLSKSQVDCVVTDVEMPRMNGYDLTASIKQTENLGGIPVVIVSSRSSDDDRRKGIEAGADAYVVKGTFDQQNLLDTIERLVA